MEHHLNRSSCNFASPNTTSSDDSGWSLFDLIMGLWLPGMLSLIGIIGNILSLWVLSKDPVGSASFTSLKALAMSDVVLLVCAFLQQIIPVSCDLLRTVDAFCLQFAGYLRVYSWPVVCIAQMTSIWLTVLISAERFLAICAPLYVDLQGDVNKIKLSVVLIVISSTVFNVPRFFEFTPIEDELLVDTIVELSDTCKYLQVVNYTKVDIGDSTFRYNIVYRYLYNTAFNVLFTYAIPLIVLTYLNFRLVLELKRARRNWIFLNSNQKKELNATKLPLAIVFVFFTSGTVSLLGFILDAVFVHEDHRWLQIFTAVVNLLVILNAAVNFLLMFFFGKKFRRMLNEAVRCRSQRKSVRFKSRSYYTAASMRESYV